MECTKIFYIFSFTLTVNDMADQNLKKITWLIKKQCIVMLTRSSSRSFELQKSIIYR